jgi:hypothetical protein
MKAIDAILLGALVLIVSNIATHFILKAIDPSEGAF